MKEDHRAATIFAGIFTTVQALLWSSVTVYSIGVITCIFDFPGYNGKELSSWDLVYWSYFLGQCRGGQTPSTSQRTYYFMLSTGILSAIWIPSSVLLLVAAVNKLRGSQGARCYYPWLINTALILVLDVISTAFYVIDISHTLTVEEYAKRYPYIPYTRLPEGLTVVPAVIMTVFFSRALIIWLVDIILVGIVIHSVNSLYYVSPTAAFVEAEARQKPGSRGSVTPTWVRVKDRSSGAVSLPRIEVVERLELSPAPPIPAEHPPSPRPGSRSPTPPPARSSPSPPARSSPPPRPKLLHLTNSRLLYDVYGRPTTPESPQPHFQRSPLEENSSRSGGMSPWSYSKPPPVPPPPPPVDLPSPDYTLHFPPRRQPSDESSSFEILPPRKRYENNPNVWKVM